MIRYLISLLFLFSSSTHAQILNLSNNEHVLSDLNASLRVQLQHLTLRIPHTPEAIRSAELRDAKGREIKFRMLADQELGYIIGTHRPSLTLELIKNYDTEESTGFVITGRQGEDLIALSSDDVFVTDLSFGEYCVKLEPLTAGAVPLAVSIAVDVSGSMSHAKPDIIGSLDGFLGELPDDAECQVSLFDSDQYYLAPPAQEGGIVYVTSGPVETTACKCQSRSKFGPRAGVKWVHFC